MTCCFFGNRNTPESVANVLRSTIIDLIENHYVDTFFVGNQGNFDIIVYEQLKNLKELYPHITYKVILAYKPSPYGKFANNPDFVYPKKVAQLAGRVSAIPVRNRYMIEYSDFVVCHTPYRGNASYFVEVARQQKKIIIDLTQQL